MQFIEFLEHHLGEIRYGWNKDGNGKSLPFQIVKFSKGPFEGTATFATLGLSNHILEIPGRKEGVRQELLMISCSNFGDENIPGILSDVGVSLLQHHSALLRGEVIGPYGPLFNHSPLEALYSSIPVYFSNDFHTYLKDEDSSIIMTWLIPITSAEAAYIQTYGWERFEDILEKEDPDLVDYKRKSII